MKIGLLYPSSKAHPHISFDFLEGLKGGLDHKEMLQEVQLVAENIGFGSQEKEVFQKAEKLLLIDGVDLLVAYVDLRVMPMLQPLFNASKKLVIAVHHGANYPEDWTPQQNVVNLCLQHSFLCWLTGKLAAQEKSRTAAYATSFYDCGYLHTAALLKSFTLGSGEIRFNYVNRQLYDDSFEIGELRQFLTNNREVASLLCVFDSKPASLFYRQLKSFKAITPLHLFASPMMLETAALKEIEGNTIPFSLQGYLPWTATIDTEPNHHFVQSIQEKTKKTATIFNLLGWETAQVISSILSAAENNFSDGALLCSKLYGLNFLSPRGELKLDLDTHYFTAPVVKFKQDANSDAPEIKLEEFPIQDWKDFTNNRLEGMSTGWMNTYLCY